MSLIKNRKVDASKIDGVIDISHIPAAALERLVKVENKDARLALTIKDVQKGDSVQQLDTKNIYMVADDTKLNSEEGYVQYTAAANGGGGTDSNLATIETEAAASKTFAAGDFVTIDGLLYKVTNGINKGTTWADVVGNTNYMVRNALADEVTLTENRLKNPDLDGPGSYIGRRVEGGGIIFFDYAIGFKGGIGDGLGGLLSISPKSGLFNKYHVNSAGVVVKDIDYGNDRFYVVQDRDWWNVNTGGPLAWALDSTTTPTLNTNLGTSQEFGTGRDNTGKCIKAFMTDRNNTYRLVWKVINPSDGTWFVPSIEELQVFMFMSIPNAIRKSYNESTQLTQLPMNYYFGYWSSSEHAASTAWNAFFDDGSVDRGPKSYQGSLRVRLVRTF